jgi:hypothetical protein
VGGKRSCGFYLSPISAENKGYLTAGLLSSGDQKSNWSGTRVKPPVASRLAVQRVSIRDRALVTKQVMATLSGMVKWISSPRIFGLAVILVMVFSWQCASRRGPKAVGPSGLRPSELLAQKPPQPAPKLVGSGDAARRAVVEFLAWAGASTPSQREEARREIVAAAGNRDIVKALCDEITAARTKDHSRALLGLSVLGEMRSPYALGYLRDFIHIPLPPPRRLLEGEDPDQTAIAILQGKAVSGLAYMNTAESNAQVFWAVSSHESRIVRAEAIRTYLANHQNSAEAKATLRKYVRKGEELFLDRPNRDPGDTAEIFNRKLDQYLQVHQELAAPAPEHGSGSGEPGKGYDFNRRPPRF